MVCLDTDIIIDFLKKQKSIINKIKSLEDKNAIISTTSINSFELFKGVVNQINRKKEHQGLMHFFMNSSIFDFTFSTSQKAAEIFNDLKSKGNMIELPDIMIAAVCIENQELLLTRNTKHFARIPELKLESL